MKIKRQLSNGLAGEAKETLAAVGKTLLCNVLPWAFVLIAWTILHPFAVELLNYVLESYRSDPLQAALLLGSAFIVMSGVRSAVNGYRSRMRNRVVMVDPFLLGADYVVPARMIDNKPMTAERKALAESYPDDVLDSVIALSEPGDSMTVLKERADKLMLLIEPKLELDGISRHEAAHALTAKATGCIVIGAKIIEGGHPRGRVEFVAGLGMTPEDYLWASLTATVAGWAIDETDGRSNTGSMSDLSAVSDTTQKIISIGRNPTSYSGLLRFDDMISAARTQAREIVDSNQETFHKLADELLAHKWLNSHDLREIMKDVESSHTVKV